MSHENHTDKSTGELQDRVWELAESIGTCMLTSWNGEHQRARPMAAYVKRDDHCVFFLTDAGSEKVKEIERYPSVTAAFADTGGNKYVAVTGDAAITDDRAKIKELWTPFAQAWWEGPEDPAIRLVTLNPDDAELWDSPNKLIATAVMLTAAVTGNRPKMGGNARVDI